ncbi:MAG: hypothetical protein FJ088_05730 [Deltaproteobacteria bacterium]|nr:hypothetical protein [Deltaproteobacteria bacterium]
MASQELLLAILETRYDYFSARVILKEALQAANLTEKKSYDPEEIGSLSDALGKIGDRIDGVVAKLKELQSGGGEKPGKQEAPAPAEASEKKEADKKPKKK